MKPFFSVITVSYNAEETIGETIQSVLDQTCNQYEIIVKDGKSSDKTIEKIPSNDKIKVYSTQDKGIYDAMNQAIDLAQGEYVIFMNCGDRFFSQEVLEHLYNEIRLANKPDIIYGNYETQGHVYKQANRMTNFGIYRKPLCHQSMCIKKELFLEIGKHNCNYSIMADYDFTVRCWKREKSFFYVEETICSYLGNGFSEKKESNIKLTNERKEILKKNFSFVERVIYEVILLLSLRKLRIWFFTDDCPKWIRDVYLKLFK